MLEAVAAGLLLALIAGREQEGAANEARRALLAMPQRTYRFVVGFVDWDISRNAVREVIGEHAAHVRTLSKTAPPFVFTELTEVILFEPMEAYIDANEDDPIPGNLVTFIAFTVEVPVALPRSEHKDRTWPGWFWDEGTFMALFDSGEIGGSAWVVEVLDENDVQISGSAPAELESKALLGLLTADDHLELIWTGIAPQIGWPHNFPRQER